MCGIAGLVRLDGGPPDALVLSRMLDRLVHRGPDGGGVVLDDGRALTRTTHRPVESRGRRGFQVPRRGPTIALGHRRLAITDLSSAGEQPMSWADGRYWISFNGAIYNAPELRAELGEEGARFRSTTDTEVLVAAYAQWGESALDRLNGMWAFALWDAERRELFCARDRLGIKGFVYTIARGNLLAFASEPKALRPVVPAEADMSVVERFLSRGMVCGEGESVFRDYRTLPAGSVLRANASGVTVTRWYDLRTRHRPTPSSFAAATDELGELLRSAVTLRLRADVPVGACLSGGLDSSAIVTLASRARSPSRLTTVSSEYKWRKDIDESPFARVVADTNRCDARFVEPDEEDFDAELDAHVYQLDDLFPHSGSYAQRVVYRAGRAAGLPVMLSGQGADELFGGYEPWAVYLGELRASGHKGQAVVEGFLSGRRQGGLFGGARRAAGELARGLREAVGARQRTPLLLAAPSWVGARVRDDADQELELRQAGGLGEYLEHLLVDEHLPALLRFEDRNAMAFGVEARLPFLDVRIVEFARSLPPNYLLRDGWTKAVLREALRGVVPEPIRMRRSKLGFPGPIEASRNVRASKVEAAWRRLGDARWVSGAFPLDMRTVEGRALGLRARVLDAFTRKCLGAG